jgi:hypothetical protein
MSQLQDRVQEELKQAMRAQEPIRRSALRMLIAAFKNAEIEARHPLNEDEALAVVQKQAKQRQESIAEFQKAARHDLVAQEQAELEVLQVYLPEQATPDEIEAAARKLVAETGASTARDIGKVMPVLVKQFAGRADGRTINEIVRSLLGA